ncbi:MAG: TauD/TfdA family dioxygenase [Granulosicoccus sp.]|nr:TauD/TfdA family dioxygenase [Granulosicoccus sp.]
MALQLTTDNGTGAYVAGVDLRNLDVGVINELRQALGEYGVLFFREQSLSPEDHIVLAEKFGRININRFFRPVDEFPQIATVLKEPDQTKNIGEQWHTDHSYDQQPALGSILVARELPATGGDTLFSSMFAAYDALPAAMKNRVQGLTALHSSRHVFGEKAYDAKYKKDTEGRLGNAAAATQDSIHPVVIKHPISGKQAIYVNPDFTLRIAEMDEQESNSLLEELYQHCQNDAFTHRFSWEEGSVVFWDNRATWHKALNDYPGQRRLMHRITIEGEALHAA